MRCVKAESVDVWLGALILVLVLVGCCPDAFYEATVADPTVRLPLDEASHCYGAEWWYYTGRVTTEEAHGYGIEAVIFHVPRLPFLVLADGWAAHFAVLNEASGTFVYEQGRWLGPPIIDGPQADGFDLCTPLVQMTGSAGQDHLRAAMLDGPYAVDLILNDERGAVRHGVGGYVPYGPDASSFYYSRPRMQAVGTLQIDGQPFRVSGYLWFDRQWGRALGSPWLRWDWFSLRLDDGTDVMLFVFRDEAAPVSFGTYIPGAGEAVGLGGDEFIVAPTAWWTSPHTGITYPVAWDIYVVPQELALTVRAVVNDQELDVRASTWNVYWEGLCTVAGTHGGLPVAGEAYVELTNYPR